MIGAAEKKLYDAASNGDVTAFQEMVREDAYLLEEATFACSRNLLHIATMRGQAGIVDEVLKMNLRLARSLDSQQSSPLHIAAEEGNVEIAKKLLSVAPETCGWRNCQGMNPIHVAAMNGRVEILEELLRINSLAAMERVYRGQTVLHLCVKHRQLRALEVLVEKLGELVDAKDEDGETILHWAVRSKEVEFSWIKILLSSEAPEMCWSLDCQNMNLIHIAAINGRVDILEELLRIDYLPAMQRVHRGQTVLHLCVKHGQLRALHVLVEKLGELVNAKDEDGETILHRAVRSNQLEMIRYLVEGKKIKKDTENSMGKTALNILNETPPDATNNHLEIRKILSKLAKEIFFKRASLGKVTDMTMVVMVLIATMAYQAAISPPGGVWQDDSSKHKAGDAVMAFTNLIKYRIFVFFNTVAFASSILTISLLTTTLPSNSIIFFRIAIFGMWLSLSCIGMSYTFAMFLTTPDLQSRYYVGYAGIVVCSPITSFGVTVGSVRILTWYSSWKAKREHSLSRGINV